MIIVGIILVIGIIVGTVALLPDEEDGIYGKWGDPAYPEGYYIAFGRDGTFVGAEGGRVEVEGTWQIVDNNKIRIEISGLRGGGGRVPLSDRK
ncbi:hypothetical protein M1N77_04480 [Thermodesulfovibrionales bacterium]|nr:hypothetical protein [Thermodesulfovibrionales bacterium]